jgi:hypothetical protein
MSEWEFYFINSCIDLDINWVSSHLINQRKNVYSHTSKVASDETTTPTKSRLNPHHYFLPSKPHENGLLSTSAGDSNGILLSLQTRRRIEEDYEPTLRQTSQDTKFDRNNFTKCQPRKMKTLIVDLFDYQEGAQIVVDRLYGGLDLVEDLAEKKLFCLAKCKSNRPSWLFKDFLHKIINNKKNPEIGDCAIANGTFKFDFGDIPFYAFSVVTKIKNQHSLTIDNFISTSHDEKSLQLSSVVREEGVMEKDDSVAT